MAFNPDAFDQDAFSPTAFNFGEGEEGVLVPDVIGDDQAAGTSELEGAGFVVEVLSAYHESVPIGDIISQDPLGGTNAPEGSTVVITVSAGPAPAPGDDNVQITWQATWKPAWRESYG